MKFTVLTLLALAAVACGRSVDFEDILEDITAFNYLEKHAIPLANNIREAEEAEDAADGSRIVGGSTSSVGQFPYQAGLIITLPRGQGVCGGSLLTNRRVLTAAHCWWDGRNQASRFTVVLGSNRLFTGGSRQDSRDVVMHGSWNPNTVRNDIAVIRMSNAVGLSNSIATIALPSGSQLNQNFAGQRATASGFGRTSDSGSIGSNQGLSHVAVDVITNAVCTQTYGAVIQASNICTSGVGGRGICQGDSGGPLVITRNNRPLLIGVSSFVHRSGCQRGLPAGFARVTSFNDFIRRNI